MLIYCMDESHKTSQNKTYQVLPSDEKEETRIVFTNH